LGQTRQSGWSSIRWTGGTDTTRSATLGGHLPDRQPFDCAQSFHARHQFGIDLCVHRRDEQCCATSRLTIHTGLRQSDLRRGTTGKPDPHFRRSTTTRTRGPRRFSAACGRWRGTRRMQNNTGDTLTDYSTAGPFARTLHRARHGVNGGDSDDNPLTVSHSVTWQFRVGSRCGEWRKSGLTTGATITFWDNLLDLSASSCALSGGRRIS